MKNTGKKINGVPVYSDPDCPPDTFYLLNEQFVNEPPKRVGKLTVVTPRPKMIRRLLFHFQRKHEHKAAWWRDHEDLM